jgi:hypothetical protein
VTDHEAILVLKAWVLDPLAVRIGGGWLALRAGIGEEVQSKLLLLGMERIENHSGVFPRWEYYIPKEPDAFYATNSVRLVSDNLHLRHKVVSRIHCSRFIDYCSHCGLLNNVEDN